MEWKGKEIEGGFVFERASKLKRALFSFSVCFRRTGEDASTPIEAPFFHRPGA